MKKEQAEKILDPETSRDALLKYEDEERIEAVNEACRLAVSALRAQQAKLDRSQWEGCNECAAPCCSTCKSIDVVPGYEPCLSCRKHANYNPFKFCQYCGRPLTEEAWAELERRMNDGTADIF